MSRPSWATWAAMSAACGTPPLTGPLLFQPGVRPGSGASNITTSLHSPAAYLCGRCSSESLVSATLVTFTAFATCACAAFSASFLALSAAFASSASTSAPRSQPQRLTSAFTMRARERQRAE